VGEPRPIKGARIPLFERLTDRQPLESAEPHPLRVHNREELRESVRREVAKLLNTRCPVRVDRNGSVIDYGIPDFSWMSASSGENRQQLADTIARKVSAFEPRIEHVRVTLERDGTEPCRLIGAVEAVLRVESIREPICFPLLIHSKTGMAEVALQEPAAMSTETRLYQGTA
jgi:type VI secretion system protein ImpF